MDKESIRQNIWDRLEEQGAARFPFPPHNRIPNFVGADVAAEKASKLEVWNNADVIKVNPDSPQRPVRRRALKGGKIIFMAVPRLRDEACFLRLDPAEITDIDHATTISGSTELGVQTKPEEMDSIDLVISGSVGVTKEGDRIGKGEGYSDLEFGILSEFGLVDSATPTVTTVHEIQLLTKNIPRESHDVSIDHILTPEQHIDTTSSRQSSKPTGINWERIEESKIEEIPILQNLN